MLSIIICSVSPEDVAFHSHHWGRVMVGKLQKPDCGVIGFAGSKARFACYAGWMQDYRWICECLYPMTSTSRCR